MIELNCTEDDAEGKVMAESEKVCQDVPATSEEISGRPQDSQCPSRDINLTPPRYRIVWQPQQSC
jgi:hypothetical protein